MGVSVGVDVGGTKIVAGVPGPDGRLLDREDRATPDRASAPMVVEGLRSRPPRRLPDRAAGVGAEGSGASHAATAAAEPPRRAAGDAAQVPRVAGRPVGAVLGGRAHRELVHVGLAEHDRPAA